MMAKAPGRATASAACPRVAPTARTAEIPAADLLSSCIRPWPTSTSMASAAIPPKTVRATTCGLSGGRAAGTCQRAQCHGAQQPADEHDHQDRAPEAAACPAPEVEGASHRWCYPLTWALGQASCPYRPPDDPRWQECPHHGGGRGQHHSRRGDTPYQLPAATPSIMTISSSPAGE